MFEDIIKKRVDHILGLIDKSQEYLFLTEIITNPDIQKPYKVYLSAEVDWWIYEERLKRESVKNYDFNNYDLKIHYSKLDDLLKRNARFSQKEFEFLINSAVKLRLNMLLRPRTALKWFVYRGEMTKPKNEVFQRFSYFYDYEYIWEGFLQWAENNNINLNSNELLNLNDFTKIVEKIDNDKIFNISPIEFVEMLNPIYRFFSDNNDTTGEIPIEAIIIFLDDKGIYPIADPITRLMKETNLKALSKISLLEIILNIVEDFEKNKPYIENIKPKEKKKISVDLSTIDEIILEDNKYLAKEELCSENEINDINESLEDNEDINEFKLNTNISDFNIDLTKSNDEETDLDDDYSEIEIDQNFDNKINGFLDDIKSFSANSDIIYSNTDYSKELYQAQFNNNETSDSESEFENSDSKLKKSLLLNCFDENLKPKIIKKIFNDKEETFIEFITKLSLCRSWKEAANNIDLLFAENNIDPQASIADDFTITIMNEFI